MSGKAAFSDAKGAPFAVRDAPEWPVKDNEIKIRVHAAAVNPADYKILVSQVKHVRAVAGTCSDS